MLKEEYENALKWFIENPDKYICDLEIEFLVPINEIPDFVLKYVEAQKKTNRNFQLMCEQEDEYAEVNYEEHSNEH